MDFAHHVGVQHVRPAHQGECLPAQEAILLFTLLVSSSPLSALDLEIVLASLTPKKLSSSTTARYPSGDWSCFHIYHFPIVNS